MTFFAVIRGKSLCMHHVLLPWPLVFSLAWRSGRVLPGLTTTVFL